MEEQPNNTHVSYSSILGKKRILYFNKNIQTFYQENEKFESNTQNNFITHEIFLLVMDSKLIYY